MVWGHIILKPRSMSNLYLNGWLPGKSESSMWSRAHIHLRMLSWRRNLFFPYIFPCPQNLSFQYHYFEQGSRHFVDISGLTEHTRVQFYPPFQCRARIYLSEKHSFLLKQEILSQKPVPFPFVSYIPTADMNKTHMTALMCPDKPWIKAVCTCHFWSVDVHLIIKRVCRKRMEDIILPIMNGYDICRYLRYILQNLKDVMRECLEKTEELSLSSVAFPAIGAGGFSFPATEVAKVMFEEVLKFSSRKNLKSLQEVHFILHPKNKINIQVMLILSLKLILWQP